jgi:hypothetical protein
VPPPPPMGTGEIEVGEPEEPGQHSGPEDAPPPDASKSRGRRAR